MIDLNDLRLFARIVEHKGIIKAGRALNLPKSTISRRLAALEERLKCRLIIRSGEEFALTAAGEQVLEAARPLVEAAQMAEDLLLTSATGMTGRVSISASSLFAAHLAAHVKSALAEHPGLSFVLDIAERPLDQSGDLFDLYLCAHHWQLRDSPLIQRRICRNPLLLVAAPDLLQTLPPAATPEHLPPVALYAHGIDPATTSWAFETASGERATLLRPARLTTDNVALLLELALAGQGMALLPEFAVRPHVAAGRLVPVLPGWVGPAVTISLLSPPRRLMNTALRRTADALAANIKSAVLQGTQSVPDMEPAVPDADPAHFTELSSSAPSQPGRAATIEAGSRNANQAESDIAMTPFTKAFGIAALTAVASFPIAAAAQDDTGPLVLYTNDFEGVITERFEADTGRQIDVVQMSGGEILARIAAEASNPQWDVLIFNGSYTFHGLDQQGLLLQNVEPENIGNLNEIGRTYLPENQSWFPIGMAASCVMLYRTDMVDNPPATYADLADPRFNGLFGMADPAVAAPAYPCVAEFFNALGQDEAEALFTSFFDNGMRVFRTNGPVGQALASGEISLAMITSQVAYSLKAAGETPVEIVWPEDGAPGVVRGVGIQAGTARPEAAKAFVQWLLEPATQTYLAEAVASDGLFEPTVTGAVRRADGPPEGMVYRVAPDAFAVEHEAAIKTWFADRAVQ
jgi:DNA-binding transcriptional LysR family regulator/ABC-type Fe3+ transport system substrate-binding protein